jgi:phospho-N-acetylmuramoyl-pentapeptide-transferase
LDDYLKIRKSKKGLSRNWKLVSQFGLGILVGLTLYLSPDAVIRENVHNERSSANTVVIHKSEPVKSTVTTIPFAKNHNMDYSWFGSWAGDYKQLIGWIIFVLATTFFVLATSNGANMNDGMDGMCAGNSAIIFIALGILAYFSSHIGFAAYLNIIYVPQSQEVVVYISAFIGALIGFLWYNTRPAQMYMGDTGSLTIGGAIAVIAVIIHKEIMLIGLCALFYVELLSSYLQIKYCGRGNKKGLKRSLFKCAPIHDAFRESITFKEGRTYVFRKHLCGNLKDGKIVVRFWIVTMLLAALTIITLKIR